MSTVRSCAIAGLIAIVIWVVITVATGGRGLTVVVGAIVVAFVAILIAFAFDTFFKHRDPQ